MKRVALGIVILLVGLVGLAVAGYFYAPTYARNYVHDNYPGVTINGPIQLDWRGEAATFSDVSIRRKGIEAELKSVHATRERKVTITGGTLGLDLDKLKRKAGGGSGPDITASKLEVKVKRGESTITMSNTRINALEVCFESAKVHHKIDFEVQQGCVKRDKSEAEAKKVTLPVELPFDVPRMKRAYVATVTGVKVSRVDQVVRFDQVELGAFKIQKGSVKLSDKTVFFDAAVIKANHPWVSPFPVEFTRVGITAPKTLRDGKGILRIQLGPATVRIDPENWGIEGDEPCNDWLEAMPKPLPLALEQARGKFTGSLQFAVRAKPTPHLEIKHNCKFKCSEEPIASLRKGKISYQAYDKKGAIFTRTTGRQTNGWVYFGNLPPHVPEAFRLSEDPGFNHHKGIHVMALVNSLKANLEKGGFVKGGSTITMQLAKNLWLRRHKTLGRKAMEALLTIGIESCMSKPQIMELYMNVVEYGPDLYGLGPAAKHYFRKSPYNLDPDEAFFLAMLLPSPKKAMAPHAGGLDKARRRMKRLATSGYISELWVPDDDDAEPVDTSDWVFAY